MNVALNKNDFNINNVFYQNSIPNTVMEQANFIRILYSNELITINGVFIKINMKINNIEAFYNKYKCIFNANENTETTNAIKEIERQIIDNYQSNKTPVYKIREQLNSMSIKIFTETNVRQIPSEFILKISGLWETPTEYGITYKFTNINHQLQNTQG
jgi:uncharacterized FlaG/YvyC family protein